MTGAYLMQSKSNAENSRKSFLHYFRFAFKWPPVIDSRYDVSFDGCSRQVWLYLDLAIFLHIYKLYMFKLGR
jgi:hypothetical protein